MILQSLASYYLRESARKGSRIAPVGFEKKEIKFVIEIDEDGNFVGLTDTRAGEKNGKIYLVPKTVGRSGKDSWKTANLLWDHYGYVLGQQQAGKENQNAVGQMASFVERLKGLPHEIKNLAGVKAVLNFYEKNGPQQVIKSENWEKCHKIAGCNLTFRLTEEAVPVTEDKNLRKYISEGIEAQPSDPQENKVVGRCLVTGGIGEISRTHSKIGLVGNQATLVGFQKNSGYDSYGKEQGYNAPISKTAEFYYITALNTLLSSEFNMVRTGDVYFIFWGAPSKMTDEQISLMEQGIKEIISTPVPDASQGNPNAGVASVKNIIESVFTGKTVSDLGDRFYVLGLCPNKARISVVLWKNGSAKEIAENVCRYHEDIKIVRNEDRRPPTLRDILCSSEYKGKMENVPSNMAPALIYAVFNASPYPSSLFGHIMQRIRAEHYPNAVRCAYLKAYLNRKYQNHKGAEITVALDRDNKNPAYRLGRLFAVLEKVQEEANPGINSTIRDRFYGAMSSSPAAVFPTLMRLKNYHLAKLVLGRKIDFEMEITDILSSLQPETLPKHLSMEEQGYFALGYYHQRQDLFTSKKDK